MAATIDPKVAVAAAMNPRGPFGDMVILFGTVRTARFFAKMNRRPRYNGEREAIAAAFDSFAAAESRRPPMVGVLNAATR